MGDSSRVPSSCASPHGLFLHIGMLSYEKGRQSMKAVVSIFRKIRFPFIFDGQPIYDLFVPGDFLWFLFGVIPFFSLCVAFANFVGNPGAFTVSILMDCALTIHLVTLVSVVYWHRDQPFRLIGPKMKFMIEMIPMTTAAVLHHLLEFNYGYLAVVLACSSYFYLYAHFLHAAYDIGGIDVLLGLVTQVLFYVLDGELLVRAFALSFCFSLCFYRYVTYCAPEVPTHRKKELEEVLGL